MKPETLTPDTELADALRPYGGNRTTDSERIVALAALIGKTELHSRDDVLAAINTAQKRSAEMSTYKDGFPLPRDTPAGVLALLQPDDILVIADTLKLLGPDTAPHHFNTRLKTSGAEVNGTTVPTSGNTGKGCFTYALTFTRAAYSATLNSKACRNGKTLSNPTNGDTHER